MEHCEKFAALLDPYIDGELSPEEAARVREHLAVCGRCREYVQAALAIRDAFPAVEDVEVPAGFTDEVMAAVRMDKARRKRRRTRWSRRLLPLAACCAIVVLAVSGLPQLRQVPADTVEAEDAAESSLFGGTSEPAEGSAAENSSQAPAFFSKAEESAPAQQDAADPASQAEAALPYAAENGGSERAAASAETVPESAEQDAPVPESSGSPAPEESSSQPSVNATSLEPEDEAWVEYDNVVFAAVVCLPEETVGDALEGFEGKPYSNANHPEEGVIGTGYAMEQADFEHILYDVLDCSLYPALNEDRTTELRCIVVTEDTPVSSELASSN